MAKKLLTNCLKILKDRTISRDSLPAQNIVGPKVQPGRKVKVLTKEL